MKRARAIKSAARRAAAASGPPGVVSSRAPVALHLPDGTPVRVGDFVLVRTDTIEPFLARVDDRAVRTAAPRAEGAAPASRDDAHIAAAAPSAPAPEIAPAPLEQTPAGDAAHALPPEAATLHVRVTWFFRINELRAQGMPGFAANEIFASNLSDFIPVDTVQERVCVLHMMAPVSAFPPQARDGSTAGRDRADGQDVTDGASTAAASSGPAASSDHAAVSASGVPTGTLDVLTAPAAVITRMCSVAADELDMPAVEGLLARPDIHIHRFAYEPEALAIDMRRSGIFMLSDPDAEAVVYVGKYAFLPASTRARGMLNQASRLLAEPARLPSHWYSACVCGFPEHPLPSTHHICIARASKLCSAGARSMYHKQCVRVHACPDDAALDVEGIADLARMALRSWRGLLDALKSSSAIALRFVRLLQERVGSSAASMARSRSTVEAAEHEVDAALDTAAALASKDGVPMPLWMRVGRFSARHTRAFVARSSGESVSAEDAHAAAAGGAAAGDEAAVDAPGATVDWNMGGCIMREGNAFSGEFVCDACLMHMVLVDPRTQRYVWMPSVPPPSSNTPAQPQQAQIDLPAARLGSIVDPRWRMVAGGRAPPPHSSSRKRGRFVLSSDDERILALADSADPLREGPPLDAEANVDRAPVAEPRPRKPPAPRVSEVPVGLWGPPPSLNPPLVEAQPNPSAASSGRMARGSFAQRRVQPSSNPTSGSLWPQQLPPVVVAQHRRDHAPSPPPAPSQHQRPSTMSASEYARLMDFERSQFRAPPAVAQQTWPSMAHITPSFWHVYSQYLQAAGTPAAGSSVSGASEEQAHTATHATPSHLPQPSAAAATTGERSGSGSYGWLSTLTAPVVAHNVEATGADSSASASLSPAQARSPGSNAAAARVPPIPLASLIRSPMRIARDLSSIASSRTGTHTSSSRASGSVFTSTSTSSSRLVLDPTSSSRGFVLADSGRPVHVGAQTSRSHDQTSRAFSRDLSQFEAWTARMEAAPSTARIMANVRGSTVRTAVYTSARVIAAQRGVHAAVTQTAWSSDSGDAAHRDAAAAAGPARPPVPAPGALRTIIPPPIPRHLLPSSSGSIMPPQTRM